MYRRSSGRVIESNPKGEKWIDVHSTGNIEAGVASSEF